GSWPTHRTYLTRAPNYRLRRRGSYGTAPGGLFQRLPSPADRRGGPDVEQAGPDPPDGARRLPVLLGDRPPRRPPLARPGARHPLRPLPALPVLSPRHSRFGIPRSPARRLRPRPPARRQPFVPGALRHPVRQESKAARRHELPYRLRLVLPALRRGASPVVGL